jgi:hypothetical protein
MNSHPLAVSEKEPGKRAGSLVAVVTGWEIPNRAGRARVGPSFVGRYRHRLGIRATDAPNSEAEGLGKALLIC